MKASIEIILGKANAISTAISRAFTLRGEVRTVLKAEGMPVTETWSGGAKSQKFGESFPECNDTDVARLLLRANGTPVNDDNVATMAGRVKGAKATFATLASVAKGFNLEPSDLHDMAEAIGTLKSMQAEAEAKAKAEAEAEAARIAAEASKVVEMPLQATEAEAPRRNRRTA